MGGSNSKPVQTPTATAPPSEITPSQGNATPTTQVNAKLTTPAPTPVTVPAPVTPTNANAAQTSSIDTAHQAYNRFQTMPKPTWFGYNHPVTDELIMQWLVAVTSLVFVSEGLLAYTKVGRSYVIQSQFPIWTRRLPLYSVSAICGWFANRYCLPPPIPMKALEEKRRRQEEARKKKELAYLAKKRSEE